ncbi:hypothetical protein FHP25_22160 [Vineibacter terrae]|uniref:Uncharacterized protein n=1 Tax=Vineibacter terrae TaxID=2586908 RepID=A0A5C8PIG8_9HYPH|nr:hypothetical protein [Vineibacter terrae]TXL73139.1 hypothetical protein FHP25_22160 [Vineibacter terrae]
MTTQSGAPPPSPPGTSSGPSAEQAPASPPPERRVHLFDAAESQRARVLSSFDSQREAILKAVADQRTAALAPIQAVRTRMAQVPPSLRGILPGDGRAAAPAGMDQRAIVAAQIIADLKVLIAEEVGRQLLILLTPPHDSRVPEASADVPSNAASNLKVPQPE